MAEILVFPSSRAPSPLRASDRAPLSYRYPALSLKTICEGIIFGCFLIALVLMIFAVGG